MRTLLCALLLLLSVSAVAQESEAERFQIITAQSKTFLLDTRTGKTWHWVKVRFTKDVTEELWVYVERFNSRDELLEYAKAVKARERAKKEEVGP